MSSFLTLSAGEYVISSHGVILSNGRREAYWFLTNLQEINYQPQAVVSTPDPGVFELVDHKYADWDQCGRDPNIYMVDEF
jgi:hypothetical protein